MNSTIDQAAKVIQARMWNWPSAGRDIAKALADAGLLAPETRTVTTSEELDALPESTVLKDAAGFIWQRFGGRWHRIPEHTSLPLLPATILTPAPSPTANTTPSREQIEDELYEHEVMESRNLGRYRTEYTCACGESWVVDGHSYKPHSNIKRHMADAILAPLKGETND